MIFMAFDGVVTKSIVCELQCLLGGKINKVFEPNRNEVLFGIYCNCKNYLLNASIDSANYRVNLTTHSKPNPQNALNFCMVLRKHLLGGIVRRIYSNGFERIVFIEVECHNELNDLITKTLVVELMGKHSNIILLSDKGIVIDSLRHLNKFDNSTRDIFPGSMYVDIVSNKIDFSEVKTFNDFYCLLGSSNSISNVISKKLNGFGKKNVLGLLNSIGVDDNSNNLNDLKKLYSHLKDLCLALNSNVFPSSYHAIICNDSNGEYFIDISDSHDFDELSVNFFIDDFYFLKEEQEQLKNYKSAVSRLVLSQIHKLQDRIANINLKIEECNKIDLYKLYGELITSNLYRISDYPQSSIVVENYYENNEPITIPLDSTISPSKNAKNFFKKYRKLQNTIAIVSKQKELANAELDYLESVTYELENSTSIDDIEGIYSEICDNFVFSKDSNTVNNHYNLNQQNFSNKKRQKVESAHMPAKYDIDGYTVWVGKNNKQNDYLTCKLAQNSDVWMHTKDIHGSHVVIRPHDHSEIPNSVLYKCACLAAYYSKARMSQNVPVDYTYVKYVKKPNGAKPGMVIYTDNKTIYANPQNF